jgi:hypothetical protein
MVELYTFPPPYVFMAWYLNFTFSNFTLHKLKVFENRALRRIFGPKRGEIIGRRKLHTDELYNLYSFADIIRMIKSRRMRWAGHLVCKGKRGMHIGFFLGKSKEKRPLGSSRCRSEDNIKMDHREIEWGGMDWTDMAQDRDQWRPLVNMIMNLQVP